MAVVISEERTNEGELVRRVPCGFDACPNRVVMDVPAQFLVKGTNVVREEYRRIGLSQIGYVSGIGIPYCSLGCWSRECED